MAYDFEDKNPLAEGYYRLWATTLTGEGVLSPVQYILLLKQGHQQQLQRIIKS